MNRLYTGLLVLLLLGFCQGAWTEEVTGNSTVPERADFDIPDVVVTTRDASHVEDLKKVPLSDGVSMPDKETPKISKDFLFSGQHGQKEVPGSTKTTLAPVSSINTFDLYVGSPLFLYRFFHGRSNERNKYYLNFERLGQVYSQKDNNRVDRDVLEGNLTTVAGNNEIDLLARYSKNHALMPGFPGYSIAKEHLMAGIGTTLPQDERDSITVRADAAFFSQAVSENSFNTGDVGASLKYKTYRYTESPLFFSVRSGRINTYRSGFNYFISDIQYEQVLSPEDKLGLGIEFPLYYAERKSYGPVLPRIKYTRDLNEKVTAWVQYNPEIRLPDNGQLYMGGFYEETAASLVPEERPFQAELGLWLRHSRDFTLTIKGFQSTIRNPLILFDGNGNNLVEYHNGSDISLYGVKAEATYSQGERFKTEASLQLSNAASRSSAAGKVPYTPAVKGAVTLVLKPENSLAWKNSFTYVSGQSASPAGGAIDGYLLLDTLLEKVFTSSLTGYFKVENLLNTSYSLYKNVPGKPITVSCGISLGL